MNKPKGLTKGKSARTSVWVSAGRRTGRSEGEKNRLWWDVLLYLTFCPQPTMYSYLGVVRREEWKISKG